MSYRNFKRARVNGALWAFAGSLVVFGGVVLVNEFSQPPAPSVKQQVAAIDLVRREKPPEAPKPRQEPKKQKRTSKAPPPPLAGLSGGLSGVDFGLDFAQFEFGGMDDSLLGDGDVVMTGETVDIAPRAVSRAPLAYPPAARAQGVQGYVLVSLLIDESGHVRDARVVESKPSGVFDDVAVESVRAWSFTPAEYKGEKVKVWANQRIRFDLG